MTTTESQLAIDWDDLVAPDNGDSAITSYQVQYRLSTSSYVTGVNRYSVTDSYYKTTGTIDPGFTYVFRVRAANIHGYGSYSSEFTVIAAGVPDKGVKPEVKNIAVTSTTGGISITWDSPDSNYGTVDEYEITIADINGTYKVPST